MPKKPASKLNAQPRIHQRAREIQEYGTVTHALPLELAEPVRLEMTERLNQLLADTMTLRDLYKKSHWQVAGPTFYQLHLLFDKHFGEQSELVDSIAERIQLLGGLSIAMAPDVAETTRIERPPREGKRFPYNFLACSMPTRLSFATAVTWRNGLPHWKTKGLMIWWSVMCCVPTNCRFGSSASIW